jgi:hypothetical protein
LGFISSWKKMAGFLWSFRPQELRHTHSATQQILWRRIPDSVLGFTGIARSYFMALLPPALGSLSLWTDAPCPHEQFFSITRRQIGHLSRNRSQPWDWLNFPRPFLRT